MAIPAALRRDLADVPLLEDPGSLRMRSRDFFWFSPILKETLEDKRAELIALPRDKADVMRVAAACAASRVPLTVRGGGTGNYGQAVPLSGGVVLDLTRLDRVIWQRPAAGRFEAGARMLDIDRALVDAGHELRFYPSTRQQATIGGFVAGGAAGAGSCTWGQISDPGAVLGVEVVTVEERPRVIELRGRDVLKVMHAYGVNGIITEVEVPLAPAHPWCERIATFPTLAAAARFAHVFTECDGIAKKLVTVHAPQVVPYLRRLAPYATAGHAMVIVMVAEPQAEAFETLVAEHGGAVTFRRSAEDARKAAFAEASDMQPIYEFTWNHATLHAIRIEPTITYLQLRFPPANNLELVDWVAERFPRRGAAAPRVPAPLRQGDVLEPATGALPQSRAVERHHGRARRQGRRRLQPAHLRARQCRLEAGRRAASRVQAPGRSLRPDESWQAGGVANRACTGDSVKRMANSE